MLKVVLLVVCTAIALGSVIYFFFWNRVLGYILSVLLRLALWTRESTAIWVDFASAHFSLIGGRLILRDVRYHSSNQTFRIVKCQLNWRWWIRNVAEEEDLPDEHSDNSEYLFGGKRGPRCRVHLTMEGFEWFMYNRTASFENILCDLIGSHPDLSGVRTKSRESNSYSVSRSLLVREESRPRSSLYTTGRRMFSAIKALSFVSKLSTWMRRQLPDLDPKNLLPVGFDVVKGAITMGNHTSESLLLGQFSRAYGTIGIVQSRSSLDVHKHFQRFVFKEATISCVENPDYWASNLEVGRSVSECFVQLDPPTIFRTVPLTYAHFKKLWTRCRKHFQFFRPRGARYAKEQKRKSKEKKPREETSHVGADFLKLEYAIDRKLLETPLLELVYYADIAGVVPSKPILNAKHGVHGNIKQVKGLEVMDIGNGDLPPEWGVDVVVHGGSFRYGPWADRQRVQIQRVFFPQTFKTYEPTAMLTPGDQRACTCMKLFFEFRGVTTVSIPFREASKNWQWDGLIDIPRIRKQREAASIQLRTGEKSTLKYLLPMVATSTGYSAELDIFMDSISVTSSLNDIRLLEVDSCLVSAFLPSPLQWNSHRNWDFDISLDRSILYLIRDHINMLIDLGKDWASGPPHDFNTFTPITYGLKLNFNDFELNLYANDHNIIDRPLDRGDNVLFALKGKILEATVSIPASEFRPLSTEVPFSVVSPGVVLMLTLPRWNTHALATCSTEVLTNIGHVGLLRIDGSYNYHAEVQNDFVDRLKLNVEIPSPSLKLFGWVIRHFMVLRENYFGSFTQYSTTKEYLNKRENGIAVGDPLDLKYRPGKHNVFHLDLTLSIKNGTASLPAGIVGFERLHPDPSLDSDIGSCAVLVIPELQLLLRLHDFGMEMSLNTDPVSLLVVDSCPDGKFLSHTFVSPEKRLKISGIHISANRLFGPQPHGTTYVCIWKIAIGSMKGCLSTLEARILAAVTQTVTHGFSDPFNAPSADYAIPSVPDATFLNVVVDRLDISWKNAPAIIRLYLEDGLRFAYNNVAGPRHRKTTSLLVPSVEVQLLMPPGMTKHWLEVGRIVTGLSLEHHTAPTGWRKDAEKQKAFLLAQDVQTRRFIPQYEPNRQNGSSKWSNNLYLQCVALPRISSLPTKSQRLRSASVSFDSQPRTPSASIESESDSDLHISEVDRDKRLANSRPVASSQGREDGDSSSLLDESDETDGDVSSGSHSDDSEIGEDESADVRIPYLAFCRKFQLRRKQSPADCQMDILNAGDVPDIQSYLFLREALPQSDSHRRSPKFQSRPILSDSDIEGKKYYAVDVRDTRVFIAALCLSALKELLEQRDLDEPSTEIRLDQLMFKQIARAEEPFSSIYDIRLRSLDFCSVHEATDSMKIEKPPRGDYHLFAITRIDMQEIRLILGLPPSDRSTLPGSSQGYGKFAARRIAGSLGSLQFSGWCADRDELGPSTAIQFGVNDFAAAIAKSRYQISYDATEVKLFRSAPEVVIAAGDALREPVKALLSTYQSSAAHARLRTKHLLCTVLSRNAHMMAKDLLSSVQPAFFVQSGRPQWLRSDTTWKFLFHLRHSLSRLSSGDYDALKDELRQLPDVVDMDKWLQNRQVSWFLEDASSVLNLEAFESVSKEKVKKVADPAKRNDSRPPKSIVLQANSMTLMIDGGDSSGSSLTVREIDLRADLLARRMIFEAVTLSPYSSTIRSFQPTSEYVDYCSMTALLALDIESMQVTIFPSFIGFLQNAIHVWRILMPSESFPVDVEEKSATPAKSILSDFLVNRVVAFDIRLVLNHILLEAAAENIVFEITSNQSSSCSVAHITKPREGTSLDLSLSHTMGFQEFGLKARTRTFAETDMDTLASITVLGGISCLLFQNHTPHGSNLRGTVHAAALELSVPKSAIRLYKFMEQWRQDYLLGINAMLKSLFMEIKHKPGPSRRMAQKPLGVMINASLSAASVILQVMHGTWVSWTAYRVTGYLTDRSRAENVARTCGMQIASQAIRLTSTSAEPSSQRIPKIVLDLPRISVSGSFTTERHAFLISVGFLEVTIKPSHWDSILSVQQKFGQDFNDLLLILDDAKGKHLLSSSRKASSTNVVTPYHVTAKFEGFRLGMEGHSFTQFLECVDIDALISNKGTPHWQVAVTDFALYLSPRSLAKQKLAEVNRVQLPALVSVDVRIVYCLSLQNGQRQLGISVTKSHAILQAHLMGDIGDFLDHLQAELILRKEQRAIELQGFKEKASKVMKTFNLDPRKSRLVRQERFLDNSSITISIANFGAVFPLDLERRQKHRAGSDKRITTKALLLSIKSVKFETQRGESGEALMEEFCFQFVSRFDPSNPDDFNARRHHTLNQMLYPQMTARARTESTMSGKRIFASASINGFFLDLDPSITSYIFAVIDAYRHGKRRVEQLAVNMPRAVAESGFAAVQRASDKAATKKAIMKSVEASLQFMSGTVRMHCTSKDSSAFSSISPDWLGNTYQILDSDAETFRLPELSVSIEYHADIRQLGMNPEQDTRCPVVITRSTIHSSNNALRPLVLSFVSGIVHNVEERMKQTSHDVAQSPSSMHHSLSGLPLEERNSDVSRVRNATSPSLQLFISLRIDKSRLEFTCRPDVNVIAGLNWESGAFVLSMGPGTEGVSISASIEGLTIGLKHGFLSEDSAHIDAKNLLFSITFSKASLPSGQFINSISMAVDTEFSGGFRFSRFQDILCFKAVWLDHIPVFKGDAVEHSVSPSRLSAVSSLDQGPKQGFDTAILVRVRRIALEVDLGQSISTVAFDLQNALSRTRLTSEYSEVAVSFALVDLKLRGNLSGHLGMPDFVFRTVRRRQIAGLEEQPLSRLLELNLTSGILDIQLQSDWLWLLQYRAEPLEAKIFDDWTVDTPLAEVKRRQLHLYSSVSGSRVVAMMTIMAIPKLLMYAGKLRSSLDSQREGASRESSAFRSTRLPKPDNALSEVANAMFRSAKSKLKESESLSYVINQHMQLQLSELIFVVLPRSQGDTELARFIGRNVMAQLDRTVQQVDLPAHRDLCLSLSYMSISQLIKQGFDPRSSGQEFDVLTTSGRSFQGAESVIFSLPAMDMRMISDEGSEEGRKVLPYDFVSKFVRRGGQKREDIQISLNIRLYSWLTSLRKTLSRELKRAQEVANWRALTVSPISPTGPRFASPDTVASPFSSENEGSPPASSPSSRGPSRPASPVRSRSVESVILGTPSKGKSAQYPVSIASPKFGLPDTKKTGEQNVAHDSVQSATTSGAPAEKPVTSDAPTKKSQGIVYIPHSRKIERLTVKQLGEATPDVMHPFFTKRAGFNLEESLPQYVHEYATLPLEEIMKGLVKLYSKQLD